MGNAAKVLALAFSCAATQAVAEGPPAADVPAADSGYCQWVQGVAGAERALLLAPELFGRIGYVNAGETAGVEPLGVQAPRFTVGLIYSLNRLYRGIQLGRRSDAECRRYQAQEALSAALEAGPRVGMAAALAARAAELERALPEAERIVGELRESVRQATSTIEELNAAQLRLDELRALASQTAVDRERIAQARPVRKVALPVLFSQYQAADAEVEKVSGGLRRAAAWDLELRGGYDRIFNDRSQNSVFGFLTLTFNLGGLFQSSGNARAMEGRRAWSAQSGQETERRTAALLAELRAQRAAERTRLKDVSTLRADLEAQQRGIAQIQTVKLLRYRDFLWFEVARLRAEQAYLRAHVQELDALLGG